LNNFSDDQEGESTEAIATNVNLQEQPFNLNQEKGIPSREEDQAANKRSSPYNETQEELTDDPRRSYKYKPY